MVAVLVSLAVWIQKQNKKKWSFDLVRRFWATLLLHTTCVRSCCTWRASCVAAFNKVVSG